jgi:hypothetical protein
VAESRPLRGSALCGAQRSAAARAIARQQPVGRRTAAQQLTTACRAELERPAAEVELTERRAPTRDDPVSQALLAHTDTPTSDNAPVRRASYGLSTRKPASHIRSIGGLRTRDDAASRLPFPTHLSAPGQQLDA